MVINTPEQIKLLFWSIGGTVCDDRFSDKSAEAICREMGYAAHKSWTYGEKWSALQGSLDVTLGDIACSSEEWDSCTFSYENSCGHGEDVFLQCEEVCMSELKIKSLIFFKSFRSKHKYKELNIWLIHSKFYFHDDLIIVAYADQRNISETEISGATCTNGLWIINVV